MSINYLKKFLINDYYYDKTNSTSRTVDDLLIDEDNNNNNQNNNNNYASAFINDYITGTNNNNGINYANYLNNTINGNNVLGLDYIGYNANQTSTYNNEDGNSNTIVYNNYWAIILIVFPLMTIFGNILVVLSVIMEKSLRTVTNYFVVSLALADLTVAAAVMPFAVYLEVTNKRWGMSQAVCDAWVATDVMACTASILNLVAIAIDRFIAVTQPIKYARHKNSKRIFFMLAFVWLVSIAIASPIVAGLNNSPKGSRNLEECTFNNPTFLLYSSMFSFYIPAIAMIFLYYKIFKVIRTRAKVTKSRLNSIPNKPLKLKDGAIKSISNKSPIANNNHNNGNNANNNKKNSNENLIKLNTINTKFKNDFDMKNNNNNNNNNDVSSELNKLLINHEEFNKSNSSNGNDNNNHNNNTNNNNSNHHLNVNNDSQNNTNDNKKTSSTLNTKLVNKANKQQVKKPSAVPTSIGASASSKERKVTKTLAIVIGLFLLCWFPFFTIDNMVAGICMKFELSCEFILHKHLSTFFVWLGYINSFLNPIIYTIFNVEFRKSFVKLLTQPFSKR